MKLIYVLRALNDSEIAIWGKKSASHLLPEYTISVPRLSCRLYQRAFNVGEWNYDPLTQSEESYR